MHKEQDEIKSVKLTIKMIKMTFQDLADPTSCPPIFQ